MVPGHGPPPPPADVQSATSRPSHPTPHGQAARITWLTHAALGRAAPPAHRPCANPSTAG
eukprot:CAMPEP_0172194396 /NCGR_PEP_ID=MMETSP1050-20130122/25555_1 /TAXON_ID=233186 /ORGANISM="Cryptomonas curvata, Strain CCAP979/52" /LENGTH=59 /DNA_ID=CAMNT_0012870195 /DNA_START=1 /DNA_END=177 /DNA_ORIENTATION=+